MMKGLLNTCIICLVTLVAFGNAPIKRQKVYSIVKQHNTLEWYETQSKLWVEELERDDKNPDSWLNYYTSMRMEKILGSTVTQKDLDNIVKDLSQAVPETFEHHYITYWNGNNSDEEFEHLEKAFAMDPDRPETYDDYITHYELLREKENTAEFCQRMFDANEISANILAWNYNVLMSTDKDAILITNGDNDTYPAMVLQHVQNVRTDVAIMNISMISYKPYQDLYFAELAITKMSKKRKDFDSGKAYMRAICRHIKENTTRPIYFAISVAPSIYEEFEDDIYNVGLAFKWSDEKFDNIAVMRKNYEKKFLKDYLKVDLFNDVSASVSQYMNASYLMPLLTLYNHYEESEERQSFEEIEELINRIAKSSGRTEEVEHMMGKSTESNVISYVMDDPRDAYWGMLEINDTLHVSQCEIANKMYDKFLLDLLKQRRFEDLEIAKNEGVDWMSMLLPIYKDLSVDQAFEHCKKDDERFPVCNISYEAAVMYCDWLTNIYNNLEHRKKKYKKVKFRLPTEREWEFLARGGISSEYIYPWGKVQKEMMEGPKPVEGFGFDSITNSNGCFLANIQTMKKFGKRHPERTHSCPNHDGAIFPVTNSSYAPNKFGMYCTIGNVAEMVQEKGIAKGGGWNTQIEDAIIPSRQLYDGPSPNVGFRVIMIVLEQ